MNAKSERIHAAAFFDRLRGQSVSAILLPFMIAFLILCTLPAAVSADGGVAAKLNSLRSRYPQNAFWNHQVTAYSNNGDQLMARRDESFAGSVTNRPCATHHGTASVGQYDCNYFDGGIQCMGFAKKVFYDIFGQRESSLPARYDTGNIVVGDYVRINNNGHSGVVLTVNGNNFTLCECNFDLEGAHHNCLIRWGYVTYSKSRITYFKHAANYDQINAGGGTSVTMNWVNPRGSISTTNAIIYITAQASASGRFSQASGTLYNSRRTAIASKTESAGTTGTRMNIWYNITSEMGKKLSPGTQYYIRFSTVFGGKSYTSPLYSFKTTALPKNVAVKKVSLSKSLILIRKGRTYSLKASITPSNATNKKITWKTSNKRVATVTSGGKIKAVRAGWCTITATSANGKKATCRVYVY